MRTIKPSDSSLFTSVKSHYFEFVVVEEVISIDVLQPTRDVGNFPPCLSGGLIVDIDPINMKV
jgi:hypothetical protein